MMNIGTNASAVGGHLVGWRHRDSWHPSVARLENVLLTARLAEQGKLDLIFLADGNGVRHMDAPRLFAANTPTARPAVFEPITLFSAVSQLVPNIGFVATATTTYEEPYTVARKFASLDLLSGGRCAWNLVTTSTAEDALNFSKKEHMPREERYVRAREFADVVRGLWDSWAEDAFPQDQATGQYLDPARVRILSHQGKHFSVKGPLNCPRSPQRRPVIFSAGQSEDGIETSAYCADAVFASTGTKREAIAFYSNLKNRLAKYGRRETDLKIMPEVTVFVAPTAAEADEFYHELQSLVPIELAVAYLEYLLSTNLSGLTLDAPMPDLDGKHLGPTAIGRQALTDAVREGLTLRQFARKMIAATTGNTFKGSPIEVADQMEDWYTSRACDGFIVANPVMPRSLKAFVELVVPELQRRKLFRMAYPGDTLRETMGLPIPINRHFEARRSNECRPDRARHAFSGGAA
jgi:N-acetyl-S-(2-succino)cysteine monooxygenase